MPRNQENDLNSKPNRGFIWMLDSDKKIQEEQIFDFQIQKTVSFFSRRFQFSVKLTGTKSKENTKCTE
jgi:hypothetical protein